jgi:methionine-rich copper-binding protein CopC
MSWRLGLAAVLAFATFLLPATPAARAHVKLVQATPPAGALLATAPARIDLLFDGELDGEKSRVRLYDAAGSFADRGDLQVLERSMSIGVRDLPPGTYTVRWTAVDGEDGDVERDRFQFRVGAPAAGQPQLSVTPSSTDAGQTVSVAGSGFTPNSVVVLGIGDEQRFFGTVGVDAQGRFAFQSLVPVHLPHGRQVIQALDLEQRMAAAGLRVERGGWPPIAIELSVGAEEHGHAHGMGADTHANHVAVEFRIVNRSGWHLRQVEVRGTIPAGTRLLRDESEGPEDAVLSVSGGQVRWRGVRLDAHTIVGPFTYILDVSGLPAGSPTPSPTVTVSFAHGTSPIFRGTATATAEAP